MEALPSVPWDPKTLEGGSASQKCKNGSKYVQEAAQLEAPSLAFELSMNFRAMF